MGRSFTAVLVGATVLALAAPPAVAVSIPVEDVYTATSGAQPRVGAAGAPEFSDPWWLPVRRAAQVSCVRTNCRRVGERNHGHWAIDFLGHRGDPIHAAGYGIAHIGGRDSGCRSSNNRGNWVWVDHGAGEVTVYFHLDSIAIAGGERVTPATMLGRMGHTGTCGPNYLHFERRRGGLHGSFLYPAAGAACVRGQLRLLPQALGYGNWDRMPIRPRRRAVKSHGVGCTMAPGGIAAPVGLRVINRTTSTAQLEWTPGFPGTRFAIKAEPFRRSTRTWRPPTFQYTNRTRVVVRKLQPHWTYRFSLAIDGPWSNSQWSPPVGVTLR